MGSRIAAAFTCATLAAVLPAGGRPVTQERRSDEAVNRHARLAELRRALPAHADPTGSVVQVRRAALELATFRAEAGEPVELGAWGVVPVRVSGSGTLVEIDALLKRLGDGPRVTDVARLELSPGGQDRVGFSGVVRLHYGPVPEASHARPEGDGAAPPSGPSSTEAFDADGERTLVALLERRIAELASRRSRPRRFISELAEVLGGRRYQLSEAAFRGDGDPGGIRVEGIIAGPLPFWDQEGGASIRDPGPAGTCLAFELDLGAEDDAQRGSPLADFEPYGELASATRLFVPGDTRVCQPSRGEPRIQKLRSSGTGSLSLLLEDADRVDIFQILQDQFDQSFVVDDDVSGRLSVAMTSMTLEEVLESLRPLGVGVSPPGPLRRVAATYGAVPPPRAFPEPTHSIPLIIKRGDMAAMLTLMGDISGLQVFLPGGPPRRVSIFASEVPWGDAYAMMLDSTGLSYQLDGDRFFVEAPGEPRRSPDDYLEPETPPGGRHGDRGFTVAELSFFGTSHDSRGWNAWAHTPSGRAIGVYAGVMFREGTVATVGSRYIVVDITGTWTGTDRMRFVPTSERRSLRFSPGGGGASARGFTVSCGGCAGGDLPLRGAGLGGRRRAGGRGVIPTRHDRAAGAAAGYAALLR